MCYFTCPFTLVLNVYHTHTLGVCILLRSLPNNHTHTLWHVCVTPMLTWLPYTHIRALVSHCCSVLQCVAVYTLPHTHIRALVSHCCSVLQCVAVCCSVLQCVAVCCSVHITTYTHQGISIALRSLPLTHVRPHLHTFSNADYFWNFCKWWDLAVCFVYFTREYAL